MIRQSLIDCQKYNSKRRYPDMNTATLPAAPQKLSLTVIPTKTTLVDVSKSAPADLIIEFEIDGRISDLKKVADIQVISSATNRSHGYALASVQVPLSGVGNIRIPFTPSLKEIGFVFVDYRGNYSSTIGFDVEQSITLVKKDGTDGRK